MKELKVVNIRLVEEPSILSRKAMKSPDDVVDLMAEELSQYDREVVCVLNLDCHKQVINMSIVSIGTIDSALVLPREIFKSSILCNAVSIIAIHNHPSGNVYPSKEDKLVSQRLKACGELLGIELLDFIITGGITREIFCFRSEGLLNEGGYILKNIGRKI